MKAPVPPAQEPFIRSSSAPPKKMILASSPPSSMTASVSGNHVGLRDMDADRLAGGEYLLHKVDTRRLGNAEASRAGDRAVDNGVLTDQAAGICHKLDSLFAHLGKVALIMFVDNLPIAHDNDLNGRRADVDSYVYIHKYPFSPV